MIDPERVCGVRNTIAVRALTLYQSLQAIFKIYL